jgi:hypothetical protein
MLLSSLWLVASAVIVSSTTLPNITLIRPEELKAKEITHGGFIIQLKNDASLGRRSDRRSTHERFHKRAALGLDYQVRTEFTNEKLFYGLSIQLSQNKTIAEVQSILDKIPEVQAVWPLRMVSKPRPAQVAGSLSDLVPGNSNMVSGRASPTNSSVVLPVIKGANIQSTLQMADVQKLHAKGIKGKGIKIAVIDTGK